MTRNSFIVIHCKIDSHKKSFKGYSSYNTDNFDTKYKNAILHCAFQDYAHYHNGKTMQSDKVFNFDVQSSYIIYGDNSTNRPKNYSKKGNIQDFDDKELSINKKQYDSDRGKTMKPKKDYKKISETDNILKKNKNKTYSIRDFNKKREEIVLREFESLNNAQKKRILSKIMNK